MPIFMFPEVFLYLFYNYARRIKLIVIKLQKKVVFTVSIISLLLSDSLALLMNNRFLVAVKCN